MCFLIPSNIPSVHFLKGPFFIWFVYSNKAYILHWVDRSPKPLLICRLSLPLFIPYNLSAEEIGVPAPKLPRVWILLTASSACHHLTHSSATCSLQACLIHSGAGPSTSRHGRAPLKVSITDEHPLGHRSSVSTKWWQLTPSVLPSTTTLLPGRITLTQRHDNASFFPFTIFRKSESVHLAFSKGQQ